jgi:uncharacterized membrane protein (DUF485 family)
MCWEAPAQAIVAPNVNGIAHAAGVDLLAARQHLSEPDMDQPPSPGESQRTINRNARIGLMLFALYCLFYGGYVALCAFAPGVMRGKVFGLNLAVAYGFALIHVAVLLAVIYIFLCARDSDPKDPA